MPLEIYAVACDLVDQHFFASGYTMSRQRILLTHHLLALFLTFTGGVK